MNIETKTIEIIQQGSSSSVRMPGGSGRSGRASAASAGSTAALYRPMAPSKIGSSHISPQSVAYQTATYAYAVTIAFLASLFDYSLLFFLYFVSLCFVLFFCFFPSSPPLLASLNVRLKKKKKSRDFSQFRRIYSNANLSFFCFVFLFVLFWFLLFG